MMHRKGLVVLLTILAVVSFAPRDEGREENEDGKAIQGTWLPLTAELAGREFPPAVRNSIKLVLEGERYTVTVGDQIDEGTITLDPSKNPKAMTITGTRGPNEGKTFLAIYELSGDSLRICYDLSGKAYPGEFKTKSGTQLYLVDYRRRKP